MSIYGLMLSGMSINGIMLSVVVFTFYNVNVVLS